MFLNTIVTGVCGSYITPYTEYYEVWKLHKVASRPCQEGRLLCEPSILGV